MPGLGRHGGDHGRPVDARQGLEQIARQGHQRAGVAGTDAGMGRTVADQFQGDAHGGVGLAAQGLGRAFVHADDFAGVLDVQDYSSEPLSTTLRPR